VTNLTNLIQSAGLANVDLKKLNEAVQNGQSFEDVLKGIVEELRAKANPDAASGADKKVNKSDYSQAKAPEEKSEGESAQDKVMNESENAAQSKGNKANSKDTTVASSSDIATGRLKESVELLESTTDKIAQAGRNDKANESGEKIPTNRTGQMTIGSDKAKDADGSDVKEAIKENVEELPNQIKNPTTESNNSIDSADLPKEQLKKLPLKLPTNDSSVTKSTNANTNLNVDNEYSATLQNQMRLFKV